MLVCCTGLAAAPVTLHPASGMVCLGGVEGEGPLPPAADSYSLTMVRNEREGFQLAVIPAGDAKVAVRGVTVEVPAGAPSATVYRVLAVNHVAPPTNGFFVVPPRRLGLVPDVLMPLAGRAAKPAHAPQAGAPLTYYVEFASAATTRPGVYAGRVVVATDAGERALQVAVCVSPVTLPARLPFRTAACWNWSLQGYYGRPLELAEKMPFWQLCLDQRLSPCAFFDKRPDPAPTNLPALQGRGVSVVCLMQVSGRRPRVLSDKDKEKYAPLLRDARASLQEQGMVNDAVVLLTDEPEPGNAEICRTNAAWFHQQFPELKIWCATRPGAPWDEFGDVFDVVTAHSTEIYTRHSHDAAAMAALRQKKPSAEYWWFHSVEPYAPYANVRLDNPPIEGRVAGWQGAQARVDGYEYFWISDWSANTNRDLAWPARAAQWHTGLSGAGTLIYPDEQMRPMPSLRLVNLRDGLEDWALLEMLAPRATRTADPAPLRDVTRSVADFTRDPAVVLKAREAVISALEARLPSKEVDGALMR
jgi:hypothetical protein